VPGAARPSSRNVTIDRVADREQFELLMRDVDAWNRWRGDNPKVKPDLAYAVLRGANLQLANLAWAQLREADLVLTNLRGADLRHADLSGANLVGARLMGVDLAHANIRGADLSTAEDLTEEQLRETRGDAFTKLPEELRAPENWPARNPKHKTTAKGR
jgi:Pentapeptide repeats (8 copies)